MIIHMMMILINMYLMYLSYLVMKEQLVLS